MQATTAHWDEVWSHTKVIAPHDTVVQAVEQLGVRDILEVGAGSGRDLIELHERGCSVTYSDFSSTAVSVFTAEQPGIRAERADARSLPFDDDAFELVYSLGLIEHFEDEDRVAILREKFRVSRRYVLIDVPQKRSPAFLVKRAMMAANRWPYGEETEFTPSSLVAQVRRAGINAERVAGYGRELFPLPRNLKQLVYGRLPEPARSAYIRSHRWFAGGIAGSFGLVFDKTQTVLRSS